ncbi:NAD(P)/FAD-dependent oxidoreductase [Pedobacter sp. BMA]|uniref:NAD(P)/FAD-dependent oxidoreductase n=1 Tax=Pedobacter sp. BMA TaxID=1663685 RepID=UPI00064B5C3B|nr:NAD(P)/FAD-dependent oxidoreductase [Pedobacter sp. BMA]KLT64303.1 FAD-dependent oxidoreductase [Pedobacter sp. BMA]
MQIETEILIIGGGLAGLTAALHLQKNGFQVTLIEKNSYPHHKVCGEYVSNEVLPYLASLGISLESLQPTSITNLQVSSVAGNCINITLPLGGFGLSRYVMDDFFCQKLMERGVSVLADTVTRVVFHETHFDVETSQGKHITAKQVLGAFGKRSSLDKTLGRDFIRDKSPYLAVKAHYEGAFPSSLVALHNFKGGYCGVSKVEANKLNICYLANYQTFKRFKHIDQYQEEVLYQNKLLKNILENSKMIFDAPLTISQICFDEKEPVFDHVIMIGDSAALIHPLCGNGMAMAMHGAKIAAELTTTFLKDKTMSRAGFEKEYTQQWTKLFRGRLLTGKILSAAFNNTTMQRLAIGALTKMPALLSGTIRMTHGKPITIAN